MRQERASHFDFHSYKWNPQVEGFLPKLGGTVERKQRLAIKRSDNDNNHIMLLIIIIKEQIFIENSMPVAP